MSSTLESPNVTSTTRLALASRGDALTPFLFAALERRFPIVGRIDPELTPAQRYRVAALTVRPDRSAWAERFYKSLVATRLRSANAAKQLRTLSEQPDVVFQVHALFDQADAPSVQYIDCTHRQSAALWPDWNPLRGAALSEWYRREEASYARAQHLFAFCLPTARSLVEEYGIPAQRVTVVGAGANVDRLPVARTERTAGPPTILFIGNDFVRKGGLVLLEAFQEVRRAHPGARLRLVGTRPGVPGRDGVEVLGRIADRARIAQLYAEATVFCLPSFYDPYPLVLMEAMSAGLPVVATRQMGVPEIVTDGVGGRLVEPGRPAELASALSAAIADPVASAAMAVSARREVERRLTWDAVVERMMPALTALAPATR